MKKVLKIVFFSWWLFYGWRDHYQVPFTAGPYQTEKGCLEAAAILSQFYGEESRRIPIKTVCKEIPERRFERLPDKSL